MLVKPDQPEVLLDKIRALLKGEQSDHGRRVLNNVIAIVASHTADHEAQEVRRREHSARALAQMTLDGQKTGGGMPYGFKLDVNGVDLCEEPGEQQVIAAARELYAQGHPLRAVADRLEFDGVRPRKEQEGTKFHPVQISRMLDEKSRLQHDHVKASKKISKKGDKKKTATRPTRKS